MDENKKSYTHWYVIGSIAALLVVCLITYFVMSNNVTNKGNTKQQTLIALYNDTTNVLSDCLVKTKQSVGAAGAQTAALDKVITDAVKGRYTEGSTAQPGGGALFSAITEAYPDTAGLSRTFDNVLVIINGCRTDFKDSQSRLQAEVSNFESWRTGSWTVRNLGGDNYPSSALRVKVAGNFVTGQDAIDQMRELVVVSDAQTGRDTGEIENDDPFNNDGS